MAAYYKKLIILKIHIQKKNILGIIQIYYLNINIKS